MTQIHPTAVVAESAKIGKDVVIGPYCIIEDNAVVGDNTKLWSHVFVGEDTSLGSGNVVYQGAILGSISQDLKYEGGRTYLRVGNDNIIREFVTINKGTAPETETLVGSNNAFLAYTHIAHDCIVGNSVIMSNLSTLAGHVEVEDSAVIAGYVGVHQFCKIGKMAMVGGMTKITKDVPPYVKVQGDPARVYGLNSVGLDRNGVAKADRRVLRQAYNLLYRSGYNVSQAIDEIRSDLEINPVLASFLEFLERSERGIVKG
jgi:UDP-N-acetylglucosamine acyltransferase